MKRTKSKLESKREFPLIGFWHYGVILTYLSGASAVVGICLSATVSPFWGIVCLFISTFCDAFDGIVARTRKNRTAADMKFGEHIDSFCDLLAFGVAPIAVGYFMGMTEWYYLPVFCIYVLSCVHRLAYFNVEEEERTAAGEGNRTSFVGLPVANVAALLPIVFFAVTMLESELAIELIMAATYLLLAVLYVLRFRFPKARVRGLLIAFSVMLVIVVSLCLIRYYVCGVPLVYPKSAVA